LLDGPPGVRAAWLAALGDGCAWARRPRCRSEVRRVEDHAPPAPALVARGERMGEDRARTGGFVSARRLAKSELQKARGRLQKAELGSFLCMGVIGFLSASCTPRRGEPASSRAVPEPGEMPPPAVHAAKSASVVAMTLRCNAPTHPISPLIYGI